MVKKIAEKLRDDGSVVFRIDREKRTGEYVLKRNSSQAKHVAKIKLRGFENCEERGI